MAALQFAINLDNRQVRQVFERAPGLVRTRLRQLIEGGAIDVQRELRIAANVGVTGHLRGSVRYVLDLIRYQAIIEPAEQYADDVENGRGPIWLSVKPGSSLRKWAEFKGLNPYAVRASIAKKGTKPHPFVKPTYQKMKPRVEQDIATGMENLITELNNGGI